MLRSYAEQGRNETAVFDLFVRKLPEGRNYLIAAGLEETIRYLEGLRFTDNDLAYLRSLDEFDDAFLSYLSDFRFTGDVYAIREGTPVFPNEPLLEVIAPLPEAQLVETFLLNQVQFQTLAASKARRVVTAADGRNVVDFGMRRIHGLDAAQKAARAFYIAGLTATSNVAAGRAFDLPVMGTMAHSYIETFDREIDAFRTFLETYPESVLLVDTYDTIAGVQNVIQLAEEMGEEFGVRGIRLDSGDLAGLARKTRSMLDEAGLSDVQIFASGSLDEYKIQDMVSAGAPIDGFGVGTRLGVSEDAPSLDCVYKLVSYAGKGRMKLSSAKRTLPGRKQVYRVFDGGVAKRDVITLADESTAEGRPLLRRVMKDGKRVESALPLPAVREYADSAFNRLPHRLKKLGPADPPYPVELSSRLTQKRDRLQADLEEQVISVK